MEEDQIVQDSESPLDIPGAAQKIVEEIRSLEKELKEIRESCSHASYSIKNSPSPGEGSFCLRRVCDNCQEILGYPTQSEIDQWNET